MSEKLDAEKWRVLSEKEELICFMADYAPYAPIRRITGGGNKGCYAVTLDPASIPAEALANEYQEIREAWTLGKASARYSWSRNQESTEILFTFNAEVSKQYALDYAACVNGADTVVCKEARPSLEAPKPAVEPAAVKLETASRPRRKAPPRRKYGGLAGDMYQWTARNARTGNALYI